MAELLFGSPVTLGVAGAALVLIALILWINGGFFVFEPAVFDYLDGDDTILERDPLERLAAEGQLMAFRHTRFWQPMDTPRDRATLEALWATGEAPWQTWDRK